MDYTLRKSRNDEGNMAAKRNHWVCTVGTALLCTEAVSMNISDNAQALLAADVPQFSETRSFQGNVVIMKSIRLKSFIGQEACDDSRIATFVPKEEGTALADASSLIAKVTNQLRPDVGTEFKQVR